MTYLPLPLFLFMFRLTGYKHRFSSERALRQAVAHDRKTVSGTPPPNVDWQFNLSRRFIDGWLSYTLTPHHLAPDATHVLYLHGGAHCTEMSSVHWKFLDKLIESTGCVVHAPIYPLAPENNHRQAFAMVETLLESVCRGVGPERVVLMGDSSGGGFVLALAQQRALSGHPAVRDLVLISPWLDLTTQLAQQTHTQINDPWLNTPGMQVAAQWWAGGESLRNAKISPLYGSMKNLGTIHLFIGGHSLLITECRYLQDRAKAQGVDLIWHEEPDMIHIWPLLPLLSANKARKQIADIIRPRDENRRTIP